VCAAAFVDEVMLYAKAGDGGHGAVAWKREANMPNGGPFGGDGGDGGSVVFIGDEGLQSLLDYSYAPRLVARNGEAGRSKFQQGPSAVDIVAKVPCGTQIFDADTGELLCDLVTPGQRFVACQGGSGGFGNCHFATPYRQAPDFANPGLPGVERNLRLSLKLMADVGLLGFPNAGKSTLLSRVSAAKPKIANYPFTTLTPQLGVVQVGDKAAQQQFIMADVPGVIEGAASGAGLGIRFLKHLERVRVLCHLIEVPLELTDDHDGVVAADHGVRGPVGLIDRYEALRHELSSFSAALAGLPEVVVLNKVDLLPGAASDHPEIQALQRHLKKRKVELWLLSGASGQGLNDLVFGLWRMVRPQLTAAPAFDPFRGAIR
jgi:GTPase